MDRLPYSLMIVDDHPIIHEALEVLLNRHTDLMIKAQATSATQAMEVLAGITPDLIILDLSLGDSGGSYLIQRIHNRYPKLRILVYTMSEENLYAERSASAGARGFVMKTSKPSILLEGIHAVLNDKLFFSGTIEERMTKKESGRPTAPLSTLDYLSNREMDVFKLIGEGLSTYKISKKLKISKNTVDTHRINIKNKLELADGKALDRMAYEVIIQGQMPE